MTSPRRALTIETVREDLPGEHTRALFRARWPAYRHWMNRADAVPAQSCVDALRQAMPELLPTFERLLDLVEGGREETRFLSLYRPPRLVRGCSQVVLDTSDGPVLLRTYDHAPHLFDGIVLQSCWGDRATLAITDCIWGALDGTNAAGLAVALAFGGRNSAGPGFAAPLIVRYLLETCTSTPEAIDALQRLRVHMPYTFVVLDAAGQHTTAFLSPDRPTEFRTDRASTNHHRETDWPEYARFSSSMTRLSSIHAALDADVHLDDFVARFLSPPIWRTEYREGSGTLYLAAYHPATKSLTLHWPTESVRLALPRLQNGTFVISLP